LMSDALLWGIFACGSIFLCACFYSLHRYLNRNRHEDVLKNMSHINATYESQMQLVRDQQKQIEDLSKPKRSPATSKVNIQIAGEYALPTQFRQSTYTPGGEAQIIMNQTAEYAVASQISRTSLRLSELSPVSDSNVEHYYPTGNMTLEQKIHRMQSRDRDSSGPGYRNNYSLEMGDEMMRSTSAMANIAVIDQKYKIAWDELKLNQVIGKGNFGQVYLAKWCGETVAAKQIENCNINNYEEIVDEIVAFGKLAGHPRIVHLCGVCFHENSCLIVTHYYAKGSCEDYLRENDILSKLQKYRIIADAASGLTYLHGRNIMHRDIAARNLLLSENMRAYIADMGLSRVLQGENPKIENVGAGPIRWMAYESLNESIHTFQSDVWMMGVLIWEILSDGRIPFDHLKTPKAVFDHVVKEGKTLETERSWNPEVTQCLQSCWSRNQENRPSMKEIWELFQRLLPAE